MSTVSNIKIVNNHDRTPYVIGGVVCAPKQPVMISAADFEVFLNTDAGKWLLANHIEVLEEVAPKPKRGRPPKKAVDVVEAVEVQEEIVELDEDEAVTDGEILEALEQITDATADAWTQGGLVKVEYVSELLGKKVTRQDIERLAPSKVKNG